MTREQKIQNIIKGTEMAVESLKMSGELTTERYIAIMECQNSAIAAVNAEAEGGKEMYKVYRVHRDNNGNIFHKVPVGCAKTEHGAKALIAGQWGECIVEKIE